MGRPELFLEHRRQGKAVRHLRVTTKQTLFVIGSSPDADLRLRGDDVSGCHAVLQLRDKKWHLLSVSQEGAPVKLNDEVVIEAALGEKASIEIGNNVISLFSKERTENLFKEQAATAGGALDTHQVVVLRRGKVVETLLLRANEPYRHMDGSQETVLTPPTDGTWKETTVGKRVVRQRLVTKQELIATEGVTFDRDLSKPIIAALSLMVLLACIIMLVPKDTKPELALDQKSIDMIFNAEAVKKKRTEAKKVTQSAKMRAGGSSESQAAPTTVAAPEQSMAPVKSEKATAALTSLRNAGLSALVGKIAKRANKDGIMIASQGVAADTKGAGRAFFSNGTTTVGGGGTAATAGDTYRLGGIATKGKGGGASGVRDGTALSGGTVGTGDVAMVDEETVIEGGLDRDVIADVIKRNLGQIRYCYERQLSSNKDLYGKLLVKFTIDAGGGVLEPKIDTSTLKSAMVEGCVLRRLAGWKFPLPKGGTQVRVSYPFLFKALD